MGEFSIGEVEKLTGIKSHILRYWEEVVPSLTPQKDCGGRRTYTNRDVQLILRLKYLIQTKKYTIEGARNQLISDIDMDEQTSNIMQTLNELRAELLTLYKKLEKTGTENNNE